MREFTAEYLGATREGMWADSREALQPLCLERCERALDVGAGTGELTRVLREESSGEVVAVDADADLLTHVSGSIAVGDACRLSFADNSVDLAVCQALLVNLPDPGRVVREFARVASERTAVIEPDNSAVTIDSTVEAEGALARRARERYLAGVSTDASLGAAQELFGEAGLSSVEVRDYDHERVIAPPYSERALTAAKRKTTGKSIASDRETMLVGDTTPEEYDALRQAWRKVGRAAVKQMQDNEYRRREVVPFYVTVGSVM